MTLNIDRSLHDGAVAPGEAGHRTIGEVPGHDKAAHRGRSSTAEPRRGPHRGPRGPSKCFWPRHARHAVKGAETVDVMICFQCKDAKVYHRGSEQWAGLDGTDASPAFVAAAVKAASPSSPWRWPSDPALAARVVVAVENPA